ncbi:MAG: CapA family protein [Ruminococcaceae bacterium]|nr:CapA family protein [Oscillospiraceae bacterium]
MNIIFTGDVNFKTKEDITAEESRRALKEVKPYFDNADFRIINLECPLADGEFEPIKKSGPNLISPTSCICFLEEGGVDGATLANNHIGDYGEEPVRLTMELLEKHNIKHCGAGENLDAAYKAMHFEKDGLRVALISSCENEFGVADFEKYGSAGLKMSKLFHAVKREKETSDFVIVVFHGGNEHNPLPSPGAVERYRLFIDFGADAVVAGHTHCPQPTEYYNGKPIIYSMGNFLFNAKSAEQDTPWFYGYMVNLVISKGKSIKYELIPYKTEKDTAIIHIFEGEKKEKMLSYLESLAEIVKDERELLKYYKGWCFHIDYYYADNPLIGDGMTRVHRSKNIFNCEAHRELATMNYNIFIEGEEDLAARYWKKLQELIDMPV